MHQICRDFATNEILLFSSSNQTSFLNWKRFLWFGCWCWCWWWSLPNDLLHKSFKTTQTCTSTQDLLASITFEDLDSKHCGQIVKLSRIQSRIIWHTTYAIYCFFCQNIGDTGTFVYRNEFFCCFINYHSLQSAGCHHL